jgi:hypothetical protein
LTRSNMAVHGKQDEYDFARLLNTHFLRKGLPYVAKDSGGSGHGNDVLVEHKLTKEPINDFEAKRSDNSRTDFGQFQLDHDKKTGWEFHETSKSMPIARHVFKNIKSQLDALVFGDFPPGPSMSLSETKAFWNAHEPDRTLSMISGDVVKIAIPASTISDYYTQKGNDYIKIGKDLYALKPGCIPTLESRITECSAVFRIKDHGRKRKNGVPIDGSNKQSYTVALRLKCESSEDTEFFTALNKIY